MLRIATFVLIIFCSVFQLSAQEVAKDSVKTEAYLAYINAKEKEIIQNKNERISLQKSLIDTDSLLVSSKEELVEFEAREKEIRLDVNAVETGVSTHKEALEYNKQRTVDVNEAQLKSKKEADLTRLELSETSREFEELELIIAADKEKVKKKTTTLREQEEEVRQLDIEFKKRENIVEVKQSEITSLTISLDNASKKQQTLKLDVEASQVRIDELETELISQQKEIEATEDKIAANKLKAEANQTNAGSWENELQKVRNQIAGLEENRSKKNQSLGEMPDSLKTSQVLEATQQEIRMINDHLKKLNEDAFQLEQDISQLTEESRVLNTENENLINDRNVEQSRLKSLRTDKANKESGYKAQRDELQSLSVKIHDISGNKEQAYIALQKAENELGYYKGEYEKRNEELQQGELEQVGLREKIEANENKKESVSSQKDRLTEEFNEVSAQNNKENEELKKLRSHKRTLATGLDSLLTESKKVSHKQKVAAKELELARADIAKNEGDKKLMNERIKELGNVSEDEILKGIEEAKNGRFDSFLTTLGEALEKDKNSATSHTLMGYTHYIKGDLDQAENAYTEAINEAPKFIDPYVLRAELREGKENFNGALKDYNQVVYLDSSRAEAYYKQGVLLYYFLNEPDRGCEAWNMAFKLGVKEANEKIIEHCSESSESRYFVITQLTKRAIKDSYGYDMSNPIKVGKNKERQDYNVELYLQLLRDKHGNPVQYVRYGSCCRYSTPNGLREEGLMEKYRVTFKNEKGKKEDVKLYFTFYDFDKPKVPKGFDTNHEIY